MATANGLGENILRLKTICLISGASKGLGRCIATRFASELPNGSMLSLIARDGIKLNKVKEEIAQKHPGVLVCTTVLDLGTVNEKDLVDLMKSNLNGIDIRNFQQAIIVHNVGSMGDITKPLLAQRDVGPLHSYYALNLTSVIILNAVFFRELPGQLHKVVVNISSLCALKPISYWALYCAGKAARDMLFATMALENADMRVLNYAPGPLDTDMQAVVREQTGDEKVREQFIDMHDSGMLIACDLSVGKLVKILRENVFVSGSHVDYYDVPD